MTPERWQQVEEIFQVAVDLAPAERERFVSQACAADSSLKRDVETLLLQHDSASGLLEHPLYGSTELSAIESFVYDNDEDPMIGRRLGAYRIEREVGRGGMGAVYEALRVDNEFTLRVAIKLVKRGMDTDFILRRFRKERQILAALDHPYIARLLDGGTTDDGLPYFVMEFIEGRPLYRYCDAHNLSIVERLKLFLGVCDAVHYAHQKQVIHRDIKPSNVLVTSEGVPKLLDFGIAKLLNPELAGEITHDPTATAMRLMTPEYASPEQVQGAPTTPSTDVYSLGVLLYELLTGHRPYRLVNRAPHEIARVICEEEPTPPSVIITRSEDLLPHLAAGDEVTTLKQLFLTRNASVESLRRDLSGDLDTIMMRALRKEPEWRYQTAEQLRDDIARYLKGIAVSDLPDLPRAQRRVHTQPIQTENSLAVLPLKLLDTGAGSDSGPDYLGTGLADVLITRLSAIRRFAVRPTSSVLRYGAETDPLLAGRELGVSFVLDGRLRRAGDRIRVTIQLLSVRDGTAMWAEQFDEKFTDVLSLEDAISSRVAEAIVPHLSGDERIRLAKRGTDDPEAHEAYLRGRYHWNTFTEEGFAKAVVCYHQAIAVDPHYAAAYAGIAEYYNWLGIFGVLPHSDCSAAAYQAAATAVSIDPVMAEGHGALGQAILCRDFDWERAEQQLLRSIELNPNYSAARVWYAFQLAMEGRFAESLREARIARELDPLAILSGLCLGFCTYQSRSFTDALAFCESTLKGEPHNAMVVYCSSYPLSQLGRHQEAIARAAQGVEMIGKASHTLCRLGCAFAAAGDPARAEQILSEMAEVAQHRYISPYHLALVHCGLGRKERTLDLLETAYEAKDAWIVWMAVEPELDSVRSDPRFVELLRKLNHRLADAPAKPALAHSDHTQSKTDAVASADEQSRVTSPMSPAPNTLPSENEEARQLYAAGRYYATRRTAEGLKQAIPRLERAVELDPKFALAYAELADCYSLLNWYVEPAPAEAWPRAREAASNAVTADPNLAEAHAAMGFVRLHYDRDWIDAEREFKTAIELKPTALVSHRWYSYSLSAMGRHVEALAEMQRAREISPQSAIIASGVANVLFLAGRFDEAIDACRKALELDPGGVAAHTVLRWSYERKGMHAEALAAFEQERVFAGDTPTTRAKRAHVLAATGNTEEASRILEELLARRPKEWVTAYEIAVIYCLLGDNDNAFIWLEQAEREHAVGFTFARVDPNLEALRSDPRFAELMSSSSKTLNQPAEPVLSKDSPLTQSAGLE